MDWFWGIFGVVGSVVGIGVLIWLQSRGGLERIDEDDARAYFDEHGHWPDETPEDVAARVAAADAAARRAAASAQAGRDGVEVADAPRRDERS